MSWFVSIWMSLRCAVRIWLWITVRNYCEISFSNIPVGVEIYNKDGILIDLNSNDMEIFGVKDKSSTLGVNFYENPNVPSDIRERVKIEDEFDFSQDYEFSNVKRLL